MTRSRQTADWGSRAGLAKIVPSSVAVGSGTGSADSLGNVTFSGASSVSLNGCFSSVYNNYRITLTSTQATSLGNYLTRLRANGTDETSANYSLFGSYSGYSAGPTRFNNISQTSWLATSAAAGNIMTIMWDIFNPFVANQTIAFGKQFSTSAGDDINLSVQNGLSNSYDGFSIIASAGTMTGTIRVYGLTQ
jgi:hypothetical protein